MIRNLDPSHTRSQSVSIFNAGVHPELAQLAAGLVSTRLFRTSYWTTLSWAHDDLVTQCFSRLAHSRLERPLAPLTQLVSKRQLPRELHAGHIHRAGKSYEVVRQVISRIGFPDTWLIPLRNASFQRRTARAVRRHRARLVIAQQDSALAAFTQADPGVIRVLNYPAAHHRWLEREIAHEQRLNPDWSSHIGNSTGPEKLQIARDREVALADFILVASSFTAETFRRQGVDPAKIRLLSLGVDSSPSPPSRTPSHTPGKGPLKLLYAGRLDQFKGISYLLEAFRLARKEADVSLTLVGPGTKEVRAKIACHEGVEVLPALHHAELRALYPRFHAFAFPSLGDGFGLVVLEALAAGLYVFASDRCCAPDLNLRSQDGIVLPAREPAVWAGAFIELASRGHHPPPYGLSSGSAHGHSRTLTWDHYRHGSQQLVSDLLGSTAFPPMSTSTPFPTGEAT